MCVVHYCRWQPRGLQEEIDAGVAGEKAAVGQAKRKGKPVKAAGKAAAKKGAANDSDSDVSGCEPDASTSASSDSD